MGHRSRTTIRCAQEDLGSDWRDPVQRRQVTAGEFRDVDMASLDHPLPEHVRALWDEVGPDDDVMREDIAAIAEPSLWKAKAGQWRGAVFEDANDGQVWLVAAGLRRDGDRDDFYRGLAARPAQQIRQLLPTPDDQVLLRRDRESARLDQWKMDVVAVAVDVVAQAAVHGEASAPVPSPGEGPLAVLHATVGRDVAPRRHRRGEALLEVSLGVKDWANYSTAVARTLTVTLCHAIRPAEDDWDAVPLGDGVMHVATLNEAHLQDLVAASRLGEYEAVATGPVAPTFHSHYTDKRSLARAVVLGRAIFAICGVAFVPRRDPENYDVCPDCRDEYARLTGNDGTGSG